MAAFHYRWAVGVVLWGCAGTPEDSAVPVDQDGDGFLNDVDCNDADSSVNPDAVEVCDGQDNDCNGDVDMEDAGVEQYFTWFVDVDGDGYGSVDQTADGCEQPENTSENSDDCDDRDDDIHPAALENCDGIDNDCDGLTDEADPDVVGEEEYFLDADGDGFGDGEPTISCDPVEGYSKEDGDCDDGDSTAFPGAEEICGDGVDSDCDGEDAECDEESESQ